MNCCCRTNLESESLENQKFEDINFIIDNKPIKYTVNNGDNIFIRDKKSLLKEDEELLALIKNEKTRLENEKQKRINRLSELAVKMEEIDNKLAAMEQIFYIDAIEKEYVTDLSQQLEKNVDNNDNNINDNN